MTLAVETTIRASGLLDGVTELAAIALIGRAVIQRYESGAQIVREGEIGDAAFVLIEGICQVFGARPGGGVMPLGRLKPGSLFGEQALLGRAGGRRAATVRATGPVTLARINAPDFRQIMPPDHPRRSELVRIGEEQLQDRLIQQSSLFRMLRGASGDANRLDAKLVTFERGDALFYQDDPANMVFVVATGAVGIYEENDGQPRLLHRIEAGQCVGERGLLRQEPRLCTAVAEDPVTAFRIPGDQFLARIAQSPELIQYLESVEKVYNLPHRGFVTIFAGRFLGKPCITALYHLRHGRHAVASHVPGEEIYHLSVVEPGLEGPVDESGKYRFVDKRRGIEREIVVTPGDGRILSITSRGDWPDLPKLFALALEGTSLPPWQCAALAEMGSIEEESPPSLRPDDEIVCTCMRVRRRAIRLAIAGGCGTPEAVRDKTRAGSACGACLPRISEMLGQSTWTDAKIIFEQEICPGVMAFRLVPDVGAVIAALPGQHIVVQAEIDGQLIERAYTLSAPTSGGYYEFSVKRMPSGVFSSWLFERKAPDALIRVSLPGGHFTVPENERPVVFLVAGIGVTPAVAVCRAIQGSGSARRVHVEYSVHSALLAPYADELKAIAAACPNVSVRIRFTEVWGRLSDEDILILVEAQPDAEFFLCGPSSFLRKMSQLLLEQGIFDTHLHIEEFLPSGAGVAPPSAWPLIIPSRGRPPSGVPKAPVDVAISFLASPAPRPPTQMPPALMSSDVSSLLPPLPPEPIVLKAGSCPFAHGTHRDDGLGVIHPIVASAETNVAEEARAYLTQFYRENQTPKAFEARFAEVTAELARTGTYTHTYEELSFGAKLAWRNETKCIGRLFWSGLEVRDKRALNDEDEILAALCEHIELATHGGNLRAMMTVFRPAGQDGVGPRIWNGQLLRYAGYRNADGTFTGDPGNAEFTVRALELGWKGGERTHFDLLPLVVSLPGKAPRLMDIPRHLVREVPIVHPEYGWFAALGLKWYALPAVSEMLLDLGGIKYTAAPFNGWYVETEIGARNFSDPHRYNMLPIIAERLGLDTQRSSSLWRDRAQLELSRAVVYSFERAGVKIADHHSASDEFIQFIDAEQAQGRCVHMRWGWVVPPVGSGTTSVFHLDEDHYPDVPLKPTLAYQPKAWTKTDK